MLFKDLVQSPRISPNFFVRVRTKNLNLVNKEYLYKLIVNSRSSLDKIIQELPIYINDSTIFNLKFLS